MDGLRASEDVDEGSVEVFVDAAFASAANTDPTPLAMVDLVFGLEKSVKARITLNHIALLMLLWHDFPHRRRWSRINQICV